MTTPTRAAGRTLVLTGAGGELARTVVPLLAEAGWRLALTARPGSEAEIEGRFAGLAAKGAAPRTYGVDLASPASVHDGFGRITAELGAPAALVHLAGRFESGPNADAGVAAAAAAVERTLDGNLRSAVNAISAVLPGMLAAGQGAIVAVGAAASVSPAPGSVAYAAAKGALAAYVRSVAAQVGKQGVSVSLVLPQGSFDTDSNRKAMPQADTSTWIAVEAFAESVAFLLSRPARGFVHELPISAR